MAPSAGFSRSGGRPYALVWSPIPLISWLMPFIGHIGVCSSSGRTYDFAGPYTVNEDSLLFGMPTRYLLLSPAGPAAKGAKKGDASAAAAAGAQGTGAPEDEEEATAADAAEEGRAAGGQVAAGGWMPGSGPYGAPSQGGGGGTTAAVAASQAWDHRLSFAATTYRLLMYNLMTNNCHCFVAHFLNQIGYRGGGWDMVNLAALIFIRGRYTSMGGLIYTWLPWAIVVTVGAYFGRTLFLFCYVATCSPMLAWFLLYTWCCWRDLSL